MKKNFLIFLLFIGWTLIRAQNVTRVEYFFDVDPGFGYGTGVSFSASPNVSINSHSISISALSGGFHTIYLRAKDANSNWSLLSGKSFYKTPSGGPALVNVEYIEYFIDNDPGFGSGSPITGYSPSTNVSVNSFTIPITTVTGGFHHLYVRARDANKNWTVLRAVAFYKVPSISDSLANVVKMEYFFDVDPGFGYATNIPITPGTDITKNQIIDISGVSGGFHTLYIRAKDADGLWTVLGARAFYKVPSFSDPLANIVKMEYYIDNDPGFSQATDISISAGTDISKNQVIDLSAVSGGFHTLYLRARDSDGNWTTLASNPFYKDPSISDPLANIVKMEYFVDVDPGFDNATSIAISPGTDISKNQVIDLSSVSGGFHTLYIRAKDSDGNWTVINAKPFYKTPPTAQAPSKIVSLDYFFVKNGTPTVTRSFSGFTPSGDVNVSFSPDVSGLQIDSTYDINVYAKDSTGRRGLAFAKQFIAPDVPPAAPAGLFAIASNSKVTLKWRKNSDLDFLRYRIYQSNSPSATVQVDSTTLGISDTVRTISGLTNNSLYYFRITAVDSSGNQSAYSNEQAAVPVIEQGNALVFDGSDDYVDLGNWFTLQTFTIGMWLKDGGSQVSFADILDNNHNNSRSWVIQYNNTGNNYHFGSVGTTDILFDLTPGVWQHLAISRNNGDSVRLYVNGNLIGKVAANPITYDGSELFRIANWAAGGRNWNGQIDELAVWQTALTYPQIIARMSKPVRNDDPNLVLLYHADEPSGTTLFDGSSFARDVVLINGVGRTTSSAMAPVSPKNLTATPAAGQITLNWSANAETDLLRYRIYRSTSPNASVLTDSTVVGVNSKIISGLTAGQTYYFRITAVDSVFNESNFSSESSGQLPQGPTITTSVLQNPALPKYADVYVVADTTLTGAPVVRFILGNDSTSLSMNLVSGSSRVYKGAYQFSQNGTFTIRTIATSVSTVTTAQTRQFTASLAKPGELLTFSTPDNKAELYLDRGSVSSEGYILGFSDNGIRFISSLRLEKSAELSITVDGTQPNSEKIFIYELIDGTWQKLQTRFYASENKVRAKVDQFGIYKAEVDPTFVGSNLVPSIFALKSNYPNPFNPSTTIEFDLAKDGVTELTIFNILGQKVKTLTKGFSQAGSYKINWDGTNETGARVASGIYIYRLQTQNFVRSKRMMLIK